jgi:hypothetical protein
MARQFTGISLSVEICRRLKPAFLLGGRLPRLESLGYFHSSVDADDHPPLCFAPSPNLSSGRGEEAVLTPRYPGPMARPLP